MSHVIHLITLELAVLAAPDFTNLFTQIGTYLGKIVTGGAALFLLIDMMGHIFRSPRDLRAVGIELVIFVIMLAVFNKANAIVTWAMTLV